MKIVRFLYKIYSLIFYKWVRFILSLDRFSAALGTPSMEWVMYRAFFAVSVMLLNWYFVLTTIVEILTRKLIPDFIDNRTIAGLLFMGVVSIFNYFTLIHKKRWFKYDEEFAAYSKRKNRVINIAIFLFYILSVVLYFVVVRIWSNLGHAGKIEGF